MFNQSVAAAKPMQSVETPKRRRQRARRSSEVLDQIYQMEASQHLMKVDFIERKVSDLKRRIHDAKTPQDREKVKRDIDKLTKQLIAALS